jgi:hypothetical protein
MTICDPQDAGKLYLYMYDFRCKCGYRRRMAVAADNIADACCSLIDANLKKDSHKIGEMEWSWSVEGPALVIGKRERATLRIDGLGRAS